MGNVQANEGIGLAGFEKTKPISESGRRLGEKWDIRTETGVDLG
jgi:hypothetical protein